MALCGLGIGLADEDDGGQKLAPRRELKMVNDSYV